MAAVPPLLISLDTDDLDVIIRHPLALWGRTTVSDLIADLRACESPEEYDSFQRLLFQCVWRLETERSQVRRTLKRVRKGQPLSKDAPELAGGRDPHDVANWRLEDVVYERTLRQLRSVGDAFAWRVCGFDRRFILAVSRNEPAGPMAGKEGLGYELGAVNDIWEERHHFTLLHDLTSCLRIGDLTEFTSDGGRFLHEVKKSGRPTPAQRQRMHAAVSALNDGSPLPGTDERLVRVDYDFETHLDHLRDGMALAEDRGVVGMKVPGGRALTVANLLTMATSDRFTDPADWLVEMDNTRASALRRARIGDAIHHLNMRSADAAARSSMAVPYGIYPMPPEHCADLICDYAIAEVVLSIDSIFEAVESHGMRPELLLPDASGELMASQPMFRLHSGNRALVVHSPVASQLLVELVSVDAFLNALAELLRRPLVPASPVMTFRNEDSVWI